ncbi:MAG: uncharacterized protein QOG15_380 [Solirubrobacteraceae bacterium]|nr:uncharacterized protein [Solirubrobacteraceae bacterium]
MPADQLMQTYDVDLATLAAAVGQRLHAADMLVTPHQSEQFARALQLTKPGSRRELYHMTRAIFVTDIDQVATFDFIFTEIFGCPPAADAGDAAEQAEPARVAAHV